MLYPSCYVSANKQCIYREIYSHRLHVGGGEWNMTFIIGSGVLKAKPALQKKTKKSEKTMFEKINHVVHLAAHR